MSISPSMPPARTAEAMLSYHNHPLSYAFTTFLNVLLPSALLKCSDHTNASVLCTSQLHDRQQRRADRQHY